jgi:hypothetical protein
MQRLCHHDSASRISAISLATRLMSLLLGFVSYAASFLLILPSFTYFLLVSLEDGLITGSNM